MLSGDGFNVFILTDALVNQCHFSVPCIVLQSQHDDISLVQSFDTLAFQKKEAEHVIK